MKLEFSRQIFDKDTQTTNIISIFPVGAEYGRTDRQTDRHDETHSSFSQFFERA